MRSLPFRVIAVAGLDDGVFPRRERRAAFDLLEHERRPGDRDLRSDDRQLFLDLLLAAGARLILSYSGRAVSDNSPRAPSVVIDELLDHLDRRSAGSARASLVVRHPLQPFSPSYFAAGRDPRLFTFSHAQALAASATAQRAETEPPFVAPDGVLGLADASPLFELTLRDLADCWMNPSQFFCRRVLRFSLDGDGGGGSDKAARRRARRRSATWCGLAESAPSTGFAHGWSVWRCARRTVSKWKGCRRRP
jgi:exodeoxyribonuclease V gamma subunit